MSRRTELSRNQLDTLADCIAHLVKLARKSKNATDPATLGGGDPATVHTESTESDRPDDSPTSVVVQQRTPGSEPASDLMP